MVRCKPRLSIDEAFDLLASERRRRLLEHLLAADDPPVSRDELAEQLAREGQLDPTSLETALAHHHLPKLADVGVVEYNHRSGSVRPTEVAEELRPLLEVVVAGSESPGK